MKTFTVYYNPAIPWGCLNVLIAIELSRLGLTQEQRRNVTIVCLPESMRHFVPHINNVKVGRGDEKNMEEIQFLLKQYQSRGVSFQLQGSDVLIELPQGFNLSEEDISELRAMKSKIIKILNLCPARCRKTGQCTAHSYFGGQPAKEHIYCELSTCRWISQRNELMAHGYVKVDGEVLPFAEATRVG